MVVARLDPQQVRMLVRPGVDDNDGAVLRDLTGRFCSGVAINPNEFPEACKFTVVIED